MLRLPNLERLTLATGVNPNPWEIDDPMTEKVRSMAEENGFNSQQFEAKKRQREGERANTFDKILFIDGKKMSQLDSMPKIKAWFLQHTQTKNDSKPAAADSSAPSSSSSVQPSAKKDLPEGWRPMVIYKGPLPGQFAISPEEARHMQTG